MKMVKCKLLVNPKKTLLNMLYKVFLYAFFIGFAYVLLNPVLIMLTKAFRPTADMYNPGIVWISSGFTLKNIKDAITAMDFFPSLLFSTKVVLIDTVLACIICSMTGYGLSRFKLKLNPLFVFIMVITIIVPIQIYAVPLYYNFVFFDFFGIGKIWALFTGKTLSVNLVDNEFLMYILNVFGNGIRSGLFILIFMRFFSNLPNELESAARIDGAGEFKIYSSVMLPNMKPAFIVVFLFAFVWNWNDFYYSKLLLGGSSLLSIKINNIKNLVQGVVNKGGWGENLEITPVLFASCLLFMILPIVVYAILQRGFSQSFERSGIVG